MKIETKYNNGDVVYGVQKPYKTDGWTTIGPMTIGQIRVKITDSNGRETQYMCVETGVDTGTLYPEEILFRTKAEALETAKNNNAQERSNGKFG